MKAVDKSYEVKSAGTARGEVETVKVDLVMDKTSVAQMRRDMENSEALSEDKEVLEFFGGPVTLVTHTNDAFNHLQTPEVLGHMRADTPGAATAGEHSSDFIGALVEYTRSDLYKDTITGAHRDRVRYHQARPNKPSNDA